MKVSSSFWTIERSHDPYLILVSYNRRPHYYRDCVHFVVEWKGEVLILRRSIFLFRFVVIALSCFLLLFFVSIWDGCDKVFDVYFWLMLLSLFCFLSPPKNGSTPLHRACENGHLNVADRFKSFWKCFTSLNDLISSFWDDKVFDVYSFDRFAFFVLFPFFHRRVGLPFIACDQLRFEMLPDFSSRSEPWSP